MNAKSTNWNTSFCAFHDLNKNLKMVESITRSSRILGVKVFLLTTMTGDT